MAECLWANYTFRAEQSKKTFTISTSQILSLYNIDMGLAGPVNFNRPISLEQLIVCCDDAPINFTTPQQCETIWKELILKVAKSTQPKYGIQNNNFIKIFGTLICELIVSSAGIDVQGTTGAGATTDPYPFDKIPLIKIEFEKPKIKDVKTYCGYCEEQIEKAQGLPQWYELLCNQPTPTPTSPENPELPTNPAPSPLPPAPTPQPQSYPQPKTVVLGEVTWISPCGDGKPGLPLSLTTTNLPVNLNNKNAMKQFILNKYKGPTADVTLIDKTKKLFFNNNELKNIKSIIANYNEPIIGKFKADYPDNIWLNPENPDMQKLSQIGADIKYLSGDDSVIITLTNHDISQRMPAILMPEALKFNMHLFNENNNTFFKYKLPLFIDIEETLPFTLRILSKTEAALKFDKTASKNNTNLDCQDYTSKTDELNITTSLPPIVVDMTTSIKFRYYLQGANEKDEKKAKASGLQIKKHNPYGQKTNNENLNGSGDGVGFIKLKAGISLDDANLVLYTFKELVKAVPSLEQKIGVVELLKYKGSDRYSIIINGLNGFDDQKTIDELNKYNIEESLISTHSHNIELFGNDQAFRPFTRITSSSDYSGKYKTEYKFPFEINNQIKKVDIVQQFIDNIDIVKVNLPEEKIKYISDADIKEIRKKLEEKIKGEKDCCCYYWKLKTPITANVNTTITPSIKK